MHSEAPPALTKRSRTSADSVGHPRSPRRPTGTRCRRIVRALCRFRLAGRRYRRSSPLGAHRLEARSRPDRTPTPTSPPPPKTGWTASRHRGSRRPIDPPRRPSVVSTPQLMRFSLSVGPEAHGDFRLCPPISASVLPSNPSSSSRGISRRVAWMTPFAGASI